MTITAATEQTDPQILIKDIIEDNVVVSGWTTEMNEHWWDVSKRQQRQIFYDTRRDYNVEWEELYLPRNSTSGRRKHHLFVGVAGGSSKETGASKAQRWSLECEMRRVFSDPSLMINPVDDVELIYIEDEGIGIMESNKDKKMGCEEYYAVFEIVVVYHN